MTPCYTCGAPIDGDNDPDGTPHKCAPLSIVRNFGCDQCDGPGPCVIVGEPMDWETSTAQVCAACLAKASIALAEATK